MMPNLRRRDRDPEGRMSVMNHLRELRRRIVVMLVIVTAGAIVAYLFYNPILHFLEHPYCSVPAKYRLNDGVGPNGSGCRLAYFGVLDGFTSRLKVSVIAGGVCTAPFWLYQIWGFITPGLRKNERKYSLYFIAASTVLFASGVALAYLVLAKGLRVLIAQGGTGTVATLTINSYLGFVVLMLVVFGSAFELPLLVIMANMAGALPSSWLRKSQRIAIFLIFLFAAVATPSTDPFTMCAMAIPMCLLYEGAVGFATVHDRRKAKRLAEQRAASQLDDDIASSIDPIPQPLPDAAHTAQAWSDTT